MMLRLRLWLACALCLGTVLVLAFADQQGAFARRLSLATPYIERCTALHEGFRCAGDAASLKVINFPIRLKVDRDYRIVIRGRSLAPEPAVVYVDFFGKNYDWPEQKGHVVLRPGAWTTQVLRWPSDWPPAKALLRLSSRIATDYEISSIEVFKTSKWIPRLRELFLAAGIALLVIGLWLDRHALLASAASNRMSQWLRQADLLPLLALAGGVAVLLLLRVATMRVPIVFGDEMSYSLLSSSLGDPTVYWRNALLRPLPNQLFFDVYHLATLCGEGMLACARAINCVLFAAAAFPIFALSRKLVPRRHAFGLTALVLLLPDNAYTSFFMPEAFYFLCFYLVAWAFVSFLEPEGRNRHAALAGLGLAALSLVKPHGLTILLVCNLTLLFAVWIWREERARLARGWLVMLLVFAAAHALLAVSAAPASGGSLFERMFGLYATLLSHSLHFTPDAQALARLRLAAIDNLGSLLLLFGPAIVVGATWLLRSRATRPNRVETTIDRLYLFTGLALALLLVGTIRFTAYIAGVDPSQDPGRIHERYYDFVFGLLIMGAWAGARTLDWHTRRARVSAVFALIPVAGTAIWYLTHEFQSLRPIWIDHPVLFAVWNVQDYGIAYLGLALLLALLLVPLSGRWAARVYGLLLVIVAGSGYQAIWGKAADSQTLAETDRTALALKALYTPAQLEHGLVVGEKLAPLFRTSFYLRNNAVVRRLRERSVVDVARLAHDADWVLTYGDYRLSGGWEPRLKLPADATLYRRARRE